MRIYPLSKGIVEYRKRGHCESHPSPVVCGKFNYSAQRGYHVANFPFCSSVVKQEIQLADLEMDNQISGTAFSESHINP